MWRFFVFNKIYLLVTALNNNGIEKYSVSNPLSTFVLLRFYYTHTTFAIEAFAPSYGHKTCKTQSTSDRWTAEYIFYACLFLTFRLKCIPLSAECNPSIFVKTANKNTSPEK